MLYTVDTHLANLAEARVNEPLYATTQVLSVDDKRLKVKHRLYCGAADKLVATGEQTHLHVNTRVGKASPMDEEVRRRLARLCESAAGLARA
jgi:carnitine 3-dehydrogenase